MMWGKKTYLGLFFMVCTLSLQCQDLTLTGKFQNVPLLEVIEALEKQYPVRFFFDPGEIEGIFISGDFQEQALATFLESVLGREGLNFHISRDNQVSIFRGADINQLFPEDEKIKVIRKESSAEEKISREKLRRLRYQMINIGTPGNNTTGTAVVSGYLKDFENGQPVAGGNIYVAETQRGVISDDKGYYEIKLPLGNQTLNFSSIDMHATSRTINLYSDGRLDVVLETKYNLLEDVTVVGHGKGNLGEIHIGLEEINIDKLKSIPALLGEPDIISSLVLLPGVQKVGEGTAGFNVRGGKTDQNLILIDRAPIYYPSHFFGNFSAINADIIRDATLYKGSIPARYGGRVSSVLDVNTRDGNPDKLSGSGGISPVSARFSMDGPLFTGNSTFLVSGRTTYSNWLLDVINVPELYKSKVDFYDVQAKLNLFVNENNRLLFNVYRSMDRFQLQSDTIYRYNNNIASLTWQHQFPRGMNSSHSLIYSGFGYKISDEGNINMAYSLTHSLKNLNLKSRFEYFTGQGLTLEFGGDVILYSVNPGEREIGEYSNLRPIHSEVDRSIELGIYAGNEFRISNRLKVEAGLRLSGLLSLSNGKRYIYASDLPLDVDNIIDTVEVQKNSIDKTYIHPEYRISANFAVDRFSSVKLSYNKTVQYIHMLTNTTAISPTDTWKLSDRYLLPQIGHQVSAGYFRNFRNNVIESSVEVFYKMIKNIKEYKPGADLLLNDHIETEIINGKGRSYGVECSLRKPGGRINGRIDYTYSRTLIRSTSEFPEEIMNDGEYFPANYDKPHSLNTLLSLKVSRRFILSTTLAYSTGRPITYPVAKYKLGEQVILHYSKYNQYRIPDYFRMDVSLTLEGNLKKKKPFHSTLTFALYNITGRKNAYSVYFRSAGGNFEAYKLSIFGSVIPTVTYNLRF
jgi:hypothetical protein